MVIINRLISFLKSLRFRILMIILVIGMVPVFIVRVYYVNAYEDNLVLTRIDDLKRISIMMKNAIVISDYLNTHSSSAVDTELAQMSTVFDGRIHIP